MPAQGRPPPRFELLLISDGAGDGPRLERQVAAALSAVPDGVAAIQMREKALPARALAALCRRLLPLCQAHRAPLLLNDRCDVVLALRLGGVHLAQSSITATDARALLGPEAIVGVSCHDLAELELARGAADYAAFGPIYPPTSKAQQRDPLGLNALRSAVDGDIHLAHGDPSLPLEMTAKGEVVSSRAKPRDPTRSPFPIFALGGLTPARAAEVRACGAHGLAVIGSGLAADDPARAVASLWRAWHRH